MKKEDGTIEIWQPTYKHGDNDPKTCPHKWRDWGKTLEGLNHRMCFGCHLHQDLDEQGNIVYEEVRS